MFLRFGFTLHRPVPGMIYVGVTTRLRSEVCDMWCNSNMLLPLRHLQDLVHRGHKTLVPFQLALSIPLEDSVKWNLSENGSVWVGLTVLYKVNHYLINTRLNQDVHTVSLISMSERVKFLCKIVLRSYLLGSLGSLVLSRPLIFIPVQNSCVLKPLKTLLK